MTIVRRTLVLMHNQGIRAFVLLWDGNQGLVQVLGKGLVRTALWAVRSTGRWSGRGWPRGGGPRSTFLRAVTTLPIPKLALSDMAFLFDDVRSGAKRKLSALSEYFAF
jgi:hypothetical protein